MSDLSKRGITVGGGAWAPAAVPVAWLAGLPRDARQCLPAVGRSLEGGGQLSACHIPHASCSPPRGSARRVT